VLYLLHGSGDTELTWTVVGRANVILDNAIAQDRARPMIVVMPYGHTPNAPSDRSNPRRHEAFEKDLLGDVMPFVQAKYRVRTGPEHTAIAGLSMGGGQALRVGLGQPARFAWVAAFSASVPSEEELEGLLGRSQDGDAARRLLWVGCGRQDFLFERNQGFLARLQRDEIKHVARITEGAHEWRVWRGYLNELLPLLFQETKVGIDARQ
jgi:enterochelin esterase family protein